MQAPVSGAHTNINSHFVRNIAAAKLYSGPHTPDTDRSVIDSQLTLECNHSHPSPVLNELKLIRAKKLYQDVFAKFIVLASR